MDRIHGKETPIEFPDIDILLQWQWQTYIANPFWRTMVVAVVVVLVLVLLGRLLSALMVRMARNYLFPRELSRQTIAPFRCTLPLLGLQAVWAAAPNSLGFLDSVEQITTLLIIAGFTWLILRTLTGVEQAIIISNPLLSDDENLRARRIQTQTRVLLRTISFFVILVSAAVMLMTFPAARRIGTSLLASAGLAGLAVGFAARPVLTNLIAGLQIAITQPIRLDDVVIVENEWGRIEEITSTYVVVRIWDERRLVVPLQYFIEKPFQNWTRHTPDIIGSVFLWVDYSLPLEPLREELLKICQDVPELWNGQVCVLQVTDTSEKAIQLRALVSSRNSSRNWDLRCHVRENLISFIQRDYPGALPQIRADLNVAEKPPVGTSATEITLPERQPPV